MYRNGNPCNRENHLMISIETEKTGRRVLFLVVQDMNRKHAILNLERQQRNFDRIRQKKKNVPVVV